MENSKNLVCRYLFIIGVAVLGVLYIRTTGQSPIYTECVSAVFVNFIILLLAMAMFGMRNKQARIVKYLTTGFVYCTFLIAIVLAYVYLTIITIIFASLFVVVYCYVIIKSNDVMFGYRIDSIELLLSEYSVLGFTINWLAVFFVPAFFLANIIF